MDKLNIYVCRNFFPEFKKVVESRGYEDVLLHEFSSACDNKAMKKSIAELIVSLNENSDDTVIFCGKSCDMAGMIPDGSKLDVRTSNFCFDNLASSSLIMYILDKRGYLVSSGWLNEWQKRLLEYGFDKDTATRFYSDFCKELVFFDTGTEPDAQTKLIELSKYLDLPFVIIETGLDTIDIIISNAVYEWRLRKKGVQGKQEFAAMQAQCAEYAAILDLMGRIALYSNKRDAIDKIKEIFMVVFGAQHFRYWRYESGNDTLPSDVIELFAVTDKEYLYHVDQNRFCIKIRWNEKNYGAVDVGMFLFPEYTEKYLNFAVEIARICGLVFSNIEQYEKILASEQELSYLSYHDSLTGLYNRTYINDLLQKNSLSQASVFMFDIDKLKYVNDNYGHSSGDKLILNASLIMKNCMRETDVLARIGGDEFVAIIPENDIKTCEMIANRLTAEIDDFNMKRKVEHLEVSISFGYAIAGDEKDTLEVLMQKADALMYENKAKKRESKKQDQK